MVEVKADTLEQSFEAFEEDEDGVVALRAELDQLKAKIASGVIAAQRPALDGSHWGVKSAEASSFIGDYAGLAAQNDIVLPMWWDSRNTSSGDPYTKKLRG